MYAILKFKLPEEQEEFETHLNGGKLSSILCDLDQWLRNTTKHGQPIIDGLPISIQVEMAEEFRKKIHELCEEHEVTLG